MTSGPDDMTEGFEFADELHRALVARDFTEPAEVAFVKWVRRQANATEIYDLSHREPHNVGARHTKIACNDRKLGDYALLLGKAGMPNERYADWHESCSATESCDFTRD